MKNFLPGRINIQFTSGDLAGFLSRINYSNITVHRFTPINELTAQCQLRRQDYQRLLDIAARTGTDVTVTGETGVHHLARKLLCRWVLSVGILALFFATVYLPSRILFVQVTGNESLHSEMIIETAESCGIYFGALRKDIRSEKVKNALISALPELQWVGVNTAGCVAEISVKEKALPVEENSKAGVSSIVAVTDAVIRELTVTQGNALLKVGQAVKQGQVIISGYTDCGRVLIGTKAQGEVYGETVRKQVSVTPLSHQQREKKIIENKNFSLQIGKKLIKFNNDSGISGTGCVKIYMKKYLTLPGGFRLPVALITETVIDYTTIDVIWEDEQELDWLSSNGKEYLLTQTVAGKLLSSDERLIFDNGTCTIEGNYTCYEMIGRIQNEESIFNNGSNG